jgi:hypothetical protein
MMTKRFEIFPQNVAKDGTLIIIQKGLKLYNISDVVECLNQLHEENQRLKQALWEAEEEYLHEAYNDNPIRLDDKIRDLKEEWDREYWND